MKYIGFFGKNHDQCNQFIGAIVCVLGILVSSRTPALNTAATPSMNAGVFGTPAYGNNYLQVSPNLYQYIHNFKVRP